MDIAMISELITGLGFPIALVIAMGFFIYKLWQQSDAREQKLMGELAECRVINSKAIETIGLYAERLTHIEDNINVMKTDLTEIKEKIN